MNNHHEENILTFSACGALFFAVLALIWGMLVKSQMILFDGIYSFISLLLTGLYFYAIWCIKKGRDEKFPYGRAQMEPMVIVLESVILIGICIRAFTYAALSLFSGGQEINNLSGIAYAVIGVIGCYICWYYIISKGKKLAFKSDLVKIQGLQWLMDTLLSLAVLIGFLISFIVQYAGCEQYARCMDPLMVIIAVLFFVRNPIVALINAIKGILIMAPEKSILTAAEKAMEEIADKQGFEDIILRVGKSGRRFVYEVSFVVKNPNKSYKIGEMDEIHREVEERLHKLYDNPLRLNVSFVHDKKLG